jgi:hypothetical protein
MNQTIGQSRYRCRTELNLGSPMIFLHRASVTIILVTLTLPLQSVGMAALIHWFRAQFPNGIQRLGVFHDSLLVVRFASLLVCLHGLEICCGCHFIAGDVLQTGTRPSIFQRPIIPRWAREIFFSNQYGERLAR